LSSKKGQAEVLLGVFFLVFVIGAAIFFIGTQKGFSIIRYSTAAQGSRFLAADHMRTIINDMYGFPLVKNPDPVLIAPFIGQGDSSVRKVKIEQLAFGTLCTQASILEVGTDDNGEEITFLIPIQQDTTVCPGRLRVFI